MESYNAGNSRTYDFDLVNDGGTRSFGSLRLVFFSKKVDHDKIIPWPFKQVWERYRICCVARLTIPSGGYNKELGYVGCPVRIQFELAAQSQSNIDLRLISYNPKTSETTSSTVAPLVEMGPYNDVLPVQYEDSYLTDVDGEMVESRLQLEGSNAEHLRGWAVSAIAAKDSIRLEWEQVEPAIDSSPISNSDEHAGHAPAAHLSVAALSGLDISANLVFELCVIDQGSSPLPLWTSPNFRATVTLKTVSLLNSEDGLRAEFYAHEFINSFPFHHRKAALNPIVSGTDTGTAAVALAQAVNAYSYAGKTAFVNHQNTIICILPSGDPFLERALLPEFEIGPDSSSKTMRFEFSVADLDTDLMVNIWHWVNVEGSRSITLKVNGQIVVSDHLIYKKSDDLESGNIDSFIIRDLRYGYQGSVNYVKSGQNVIEVFVNEVAARPVDASKDIMPIANKSEPRAKYFIKALSISEVPFDSE